MSKGVSPAEIRRRGSMDRFVAPRGRFRRTGLLTTALLSLSLAAGMSAVGSSAANPTDTPITYDTNPPRLLAVSTTDPAAHPSLSQCIKQFGLACYMPADIRKAYNVPS